MYHHEVLISLGVKLVKQNMTVEDDMEICNKCSTIDPNAPILGRLVALLTSLKVQLVSQQRGSDDQKYGAMYVEVYKALGFKRPRKQRKRKDDEDDYDDDEKDRDGKYRRRGRAKKIKPLPPPKPLPPIIDTRALADEVDLGRYPSMNRYKDDAHADICFIWLPGWRRTAVLRVFSKSLPLKIPNPISCVIDAFRKFCNVGPVPKNDDWTSRPRPNRNVN
jgi:hypothetical protein